MATKRSRRSDSTPDETPAAVESGANDVVTGMIEQASSDAEDAASSAADAVAALDHAREESGERTTPTPDAREDAGETAEPIRRKRGRPPGSTSRPRARLASDNASPRATKGELLDRINALEAQLANADARAERLAMQAAGEGMDRLAGAISVLGRTTFSLIARRRGDHWRLKDDEAAELGKSWAIVAAPYSEQIAEYLPLSAALIVTADVVLRRIEEDERRVAAMSLSSGDVPSDG